ncbi:MAG: sensor histidine kinase [Coleofasciculus sp. S288]|nr:sensor histidine kinase [Coleofasciculus sp. S288]
MSRPIRFENHPFRFLLYLEWILLFVAALTEVLPSHRLPRFPLLTISYIAAFGVMGLRLPTGKQIYKILYTALEVFLLLLTANIGSRAIRTFPSLYTILVIRSCLIFQVPGRLVVTGLAFLLFLLRLLQRFSRIPASPLVQERFRFVPFALAVSLGLTLVFVLLFMNAIIAERQSREKLAIANEKLRQYALRIENQATLQERNRIARDIHDSLGHSLTALNLQLETAVKLSSSDPNKAKQFLARAKQLGSQALQEVRQSVAALRSDPLQGQSVEQAIASLVEEFRCTTGVTPAFSTHLSHLLSVELSTAIYRIVQEALTNICKYADATEINIQLGISAAKLYLQIQDNGKGFDLERNTTGFGLQGMRERTLALGGRFEIDSAPGAGCQIKATFPLQ